MARLKREKLKGPDVGPEAAARHRRPVARPTATKGKLEGNRRKRLGVGPDHKTPRMQKRPRGTYP